MDLCKSVCNPQGVDTPQLPHERLDAFIRERADELGMTLKDVTRYIDVSEPTLIGWRNGTQRPSLKYAQRLDDFMGWRRAPSSTLDVLDGYEPTQVRDTPRKPRKPKKAVPPDRPTAAREGAQPKEVEAVIAEIKAMNLSDEQQAILIGTLRAAVQAQLEATREQARQLSEQAKRDAS